MVRVGMSSREDDGRGLDGFSEDASDDGFHLRDSVLLSGKRSEVGVNEEVEEEKEVREVHNETDIESSLCHFTRSLFELLDINIGRDVDADQHLSQLETCDEHGQRSRHFEPDRLECIVSVHHTVDDVIHDHEVTTETERVDVTEPDKDQNSQMVEPMKEDEFLFPKNDKHRVSKFWNLRQDEQRCPESVDARNVSFRTEGIMDSVRCDCVQDVRNGSQTAEDGEDGQRQVPEDEKTRQLESFPVSHPSLDPEHQHEVDGDDDEGKVLISPQPCPQIMICYG